MSQMRNRMSKKATVAVLAILGACAGVGVANLKMHASPATGANFVIMPFYSTPPTQQSVPLPFNNVPVRPDPPQVFRPPLTVPTDATNPIPPGLTQIGPNMDPLGGITELKSFPDNSFLKGSADFILLQKAPGTDANKDTPYSVNFVSGTIMVSVRKPSNIGMIDTPLGRIAVYGNADAMLSFKDGVLRIQNLDGVGNTLRINLSKGPFTSNPIILALAPGHELVASDHKLTRSDLTAGDGILRRKPKLIGEGNIAVSQFSLESVLSNSALIAQMNQKETGSKEHRVLADMSRMAAVLNHVNGTQGYTNQ
jgi:hypothetical protein